MNKNIFTTKAIYSWDIPDSIWDNHFIFKGKTKSDTGNAIAWKVSDINSDIENFDYSLDKFFIKNGIKAEEIVVIIN